MRDVVEFLRATWRRFDRIAARRSVAPKFENEISIAMAENKLTRRFFTAFCVGIAAFACGCADQKAPEIDHTQYGEVLDHVPVIRDLPVVFEIDKDIEDEEYCRVRIESQNKALEHLYESQGRSDEYRKIVAERERRDREEQRLAREEREKVEREKAALEKAEREAREIFEASKEDPDADVEDATVEPAPEQAESPAEENADATEEPAPEQAESPAEENADATEEPAPEQAESPAEENVDATEEPAPEQAEGTAEENVDATEEPAPEEAEGSAEENVDATEEPAAEAAEKPAE